MPSVLVDSVAIELLIEGRRREIFRKIVRRVPPRPTERIISKSPFTPPRSKLPPILSVNDAPKQNSSVHVAPKQNKDKSDPRIKNESSLYSVLESYLSKGESERVFKVRYRASEYYYYAFEFRKHVVCPAFLVGLFDLEDYACLDVINGSDCCYIFFEKSKDDPPPNMLNGCFDFLGQYYFSAPTDEFKVLHLDSGSMSIESFISDKSIGKKLKKELVELADNPSDELKISKCNPSYVFVPKETKKEFVDKYRPLFSYQFDFAHTILVHSESKSYLEIERMLEEPANYTEDGPDIKTLEDIFKNTDYMREKYILDSLTNHIRRNFRKSKGKKVKVYYCSMVAILQSSGYGKSKLMERLGSRTPTFYSSLQQGSGFPGESFFLARLIKELDKIVLMGIPKLKVTEKRTTKCHMNNVSTAIYIYILRILFIILKGSENIKLEKNFQIDNELDGHKFFDNIIKDDQSEKREEIFQILFKDLINLCKFSRRIEFDGINTLKLEDIQIVKDLSLDKFSINLHPTNIITNGLEKEVMKMLKRIEIKGINLPSIFVIDEAHGLRHKKDDGNYKWKLRDFNLAKGEPFTALNRSPYNVFRRTFRIFTNTWERLMLIVISTSGQISILLPELKMDPSRRPETSNKFIENFSLVQTYNANSKIVRDINANMFPNEEGIKDWKEFLKSDFRKKEYFKFGRPLTYGIFLEKVGELKGYKLKEKFDDCEEFSFMASKLFGGKKYDKTNKIGLLYGMFNFAFGTNFLPSYVSKEDLIENHLMTLVEYLDVECLDEHEQETNYIIGGFLPEGVINFLSARYFVKYPESLSTIFSSSIKYGLCDIGNFGELLAQYILLKNIFICNDPDFEMVRKMAFKPVSLEIFLRVLAEKNDSAVDEFFEFNPLLRGSLVSFGYFEHFPKSPPIKQPFDLMARCLFRGSATTLNNLYPGIDLMIPLVLKDRRISFLGVQVKFVRKKRYVNGVVSKALKQMSFSKMFSESKYDRPFGSIILVIGDYDLGVYITKNNVKKILTPDDFSPSVTPVSLVIQGLKVLIKVAPTDHSYRGINHEFLKKCDYMHDLIDEISPRVVSKHVHEARSKSPEARETRSSPSKHAQKSENAAGPSTSKGIVPKAKRSKSPKALEAKPSPKRAKKSQSDSSGDAAGPSISKGITAHPKPRERKNK